MAAAGLNVRFAEISRQMSVMWAALEPSRRLLLQTVQQRRLPDEESLTAETERQRSDARHWHRTEAAIAAEITTLAAAAAHHKLAFDRRDQPSGVERLIGHVSRAGMRRMTDRRWARLDSFDRLGAMMRQADALHGLLTAARERLREERRLCESDLVDIAQHRPALVRSLEPGADAASHADAVGAVEDAIRLFGALTKALNAKASACNILIHKLGVETEEILILYRVLADVSGETKAAQQELARLVHLSDAANRFSAGRLIGVELDRLRDQADGRFYAMFPKHAPNREPQGAAAAQAGGSVSASR